MSPNASNPQCPNCNRRELKGGLTFAIKTKESERLCCWLCAFKNPAMLRRSFYTAIVVGTGLTLLNQGDTIFSGAWPGALYWKVPLTFGVPFCVATWGALSNARRQ